MITIAIDGYSGSGKGELSEGLAKRFNLVHLDTGAILRAMGLYFYRLGIENIDDEILNQHLEALQIEVKFSGGKQVTLLAGEDVSDEIRQEVIGQMASRVAPQPKAMMKLIEISRAFAEKYDCVLDGRNITSEVLPNADVKFFLDASLECRARRRQLDAEKKHQDSDYQKIYDSLKERDYRDTHRAFSPMIKTPDSFVVDNTNLNIEETLDYCYELAQKKLKSLGKI